MSDAPKIFPITRNQFQEFRDLQIKYRWDWPATFSTNPNGDVWPWIKKGYTPVQLREKVNGLSTLLDKVAHEYSLAREECGRFFIDQSGAFWKTEDGRKIQFVKWDSRGEALVKPQKPLW
jgi:hypothetical protein